MSHELDFTKGVAAIAYTGDTPWHGYGERLNGEETLEEWLVKAGMDYEVLEQPLYTFPPPYSRFETHAHIGVPKKKALMRSDTHDILSVVTDRYNVVQPKEVMEFFRDLIEEQGFKMHTAGVLKDGNRVWALAETGKEFAVKGWDRIGGYLMLATSYDGKFSTTAQFTSVRVVCNNTLSWSLNQGESQEQGIVRIPHSTEFDADAIKQELGLIERLNGEGWNQFQDNVIKLSDFKVTREQAINFFLELLGTTEDDLVEGKNLQNTKKLLAFYESGPGAKFIGSSNTTWGLVNAVSFFTDHARRGRTDRRFDSASFGSGSQLKAKAFKQALDLADAA